MKLPFTIFKKNSASPTMVIKCKDSTGKLVVCKVWSAKDNSVEALGLDYENRVYAEKIRKILVKEPNAPLVKYIGYGEMNGVELGEFIGIKSENFRLRSEVKKAISYWHICCFLFTEDPMREYSWDYKTIENSNASVSENPLEDMVFKFITLEYIDYHTFGEYIDTRSTKEVLDVLKQIVEAIYLMYNKKVVHNDLHSGNILISKDTKKVYVFDFDRVYMKGNDNPQLNSDYCRGLCSYSQCNIYNEDGYAIDFYKMLSYVAIRSDFGVILEAFGVHNSIYDQLMGLFTDREDNHTKLKNFFVESNENFFSYRKNPNNRNNLNNLCTYLQDPNKHPNKHPNINMNYVRSQFGKIDEIRRRTRDSARFGRTAVVSNGVLPTTAARATSIVDNNQLRKYGKAKRKETREVLIPTKDKPITKAKPLPRARSIADIILDNQLRKYGKAKRK